MRELRALKNLNIFWKGSSLSSPLINHKLHIILCVLTGTAWIFVYLPLVWLSKNQLYAAKIIERRERKSLNKVLNKTQRQEKQIARAVAARLSPSNLGYTRSSSKWATAWTLECNHLIRSKNWSSGKEGQEVFCVVCNSERRVVSSNPWNY